MPSARAQMDLVSTPACFITIHAQPKPVPAAKTFDTVLAPTRKRTGLFTALSASSLLSSEIVLLPT